MASSETPSSPFHRAPPCVRVYSVDPCYLLVAIEERKIIRTKKSEDRRFIIEIKSRKRLKIKKFK